VISKKKKTPDPGSNDQVDWRLMSCTPEATRAVLASLVPVGEDPFGSRSASYVG